MNLGQRNQVQAGGNMSSMTDLVFLLLIFFVILSTLVSNGVNVDLPQSKDEQCELAADRLDQARRHLLPQRHGHREGRHRARPSGEVRRPERSGTVFAGRQGGAHRADRRGDRPGQGQRLEGHARRTAHALTPCPTDRHVRIRLEPPPRRPGERKERRKAAVFSTVTYVAILAAACSCGLQGDHTAPRANSSWPLAWRTSATWSRPVETAERRRPPRRLKRSSSRKSASPRSRRSLRSRPSRQEVSDVDVPTQEEVVETPTEVEDPDPEPEISQDPPTR